MSQKAFVNASGNNILDITGILRMRPLSNAARLINYQRRLRRWEDYLYYLIRQEI